MGTLYQRGAVWWLKYYHNGKPIRESSGSTKKMVAKRLLEQREGHIAEGKVPGFYFDRVTFDELAEDYLADYRNSRKKSIFRAKQFVEHLSKHFGGLRASQIDTSLANKYREQRLSEGVANATVNRELAALKRMFNLGVKCSPPKVDRVPHIPLVRESNTRKGFFEHHEFAALREALPDYLKGFVTFAYRTGWRLSEITNLTWKQVDRQQGIVTLNVGETKNDAARTLYLDDELKEVVRRQWEKRKESGTLSPYVFPNERDTGTIKQFRKTWQHAYQNAGIGPKLFHDFRRTACRNMVRAGVPERVAMAVSGHKTRSVFDRYNIVSDADLRVAAEKHAAYLGEKVTPTGTISGTIAVFPAKRENHAQCVTL
ncbi:MAG: site-specific integrase [Candidatus Abyssobacteria bacterium SURF_17]|uniref:Site-specific integrase n=1 Tax=Candidatus Abyssobacteria bacterium SURF_17 TaxID=2093361 RepID=A0A419EUH8_9BACT|nr:MAG: site-specific integrase [Candidatus Abyssubacteria bacterium SURF_17]